MKGRLTRERMRYFYIPGKDAYIETDSPEFIPDSIFYCGPPYIETTWLNYIVRLWIYKISWGIHFALYGKSSFGIAIKNEMQSKLFDAQRNENNVSGGEL